MDNNESDLITLYIDTSMVSDIQEQLTAALEETGKDDIDAYVPKVIRLGIELVNICVCDVFNNVETPILKAVKENSPTDYKTLEDLATIIQQHIATVFGEGFEIEVSKISFLNQEGLTQVLLRMVK